MGLLEYLNSHKKFTYDNTGNLVYEQMLDGLECWYEYDDHGVLIHYKDSAGTEHFWNSIGVDTAKKVKGRKIFKKVKKNDRKCKN